MEREIDLPCAETTQNVAAKVAVEPVGWNRERGAIEAPAAWKTGSIEIQGLTWDDVRPVAIIDEKIGRQRRSREKDTICHPVAEKQACDPSAQRRQCGNYGSIQGVPHIE